MEATLSFYVRLQAETGLTKLNENKGRWYREVQIKMNNYFCRSGRYKYKIPMYSYLRK